MDDRSDLEAQRAVLAALAPGTPLRDGIERILRGRTGALIVLGRNPVVDSICDGGFPLDVEFSPNRLRELCKMDGAVVLDAAAARILRANVQLMPDAAIPTVESGTRHRTAERAGVQTGVPVIAVSHSMSTISLYYRGVRREVAEPTVILASADQALATLERYRQRLTAVARTLSRLEIEDQVTVRDAVTAVQRILMVRRISDELVGNVIELGSDGRLLQLQLDEVLAGIEQVDQQLVRDFYVSDDAEAAQAAHAALDALPAAALIDLTVIAATLGHSGQSLDHRIPSRGHRLLARVPRLPPAVLERLIGHFRTLQGLLGATAADLQEVDGIGEARARAVREGLSRLAETVIEDRSS